MRIRRQKPYDTQRRIRIAPLPMPNRSSTSAELKNIGLKATLPRLKVLEIFQRSPPSAACGT